jgi:nicotinate-nucleotide pyrophosphorylase (carboxylating)
MEASCTRHCGISKRVGYRSVNVESIKQSVCQSLTEDIGSGDLTVQLIPVSQSLQARVITREAAVVCGVEFVNEVFHQVDPNTTVTWHVKEGDAVTANQPLFKVSGRARSLLTAERTALNWLQTLSGTATITRQYADKIKHTRCRLLDTRKTIPGLRLAQKYAVTVGGGVNHRVGLFDAFLIKENHIAACGSITAAVNEAKNIAEGQLVEVEVENLTQLQEAIAAGVGRIMLDNFTLDQVREAVVLTAGRVPLEVSGNVTLDTIAQVAETGVDFISVGAITKHVCAIDLSMRVI